MYRNIPKLNVHVKLIESQMGFKITRRNWLKSSAAIAAGTVLPSATWGRGLPSSIRLSGEINPDLESYDENAFSPEITVRLNANENAYGPANSAKKALSSAINSSFRYPFAEVNELKNQIASKYGLTADEVTIGGGSTEILNMAGLAFGLQNGAIVSAYPTFETLLRTAKRFDCEWIQVHLDKDYRHDLKAIEAAITSNTKLVYIVNPNNPTGTLVDPTELLDFCKRVSKRVPIFIDEAYTEFLPDPDKHTVIPLVKQGYDIIVAKTFSKVYGMAGLRVGFGLAPSKRIKQLEKYGVSLSIVSKPSVAAASACFNDIEFISLSKTKNRESRDLTYELLQEAGYDNYIPSHASFIMFPIKMNGDKFLSKMRENGIGVRAWHFYDQHWCRVSLGVPDDMKSFGKVLKQIS